MKKGKKKWLILAAAIIAAIEAAASVGVLPPVVAPIVETLGDAVFGVPGDPLEAM